MCAIIINSVILTLFVIIRISSWPEPSDDNGGVVELHDPVGTHVQVWPAGVTIAGVTAVEIGKPAVGGAAPAGGNCGCPGTSTAGPTVPFISCRVNTAHVFHK